MSKPDFVGKMVKVWNDPTHPIDTGPTGVVEVLDVADGWVKARKADGEVTYFMGSRAAGIVPIGQDESRPVPIGPPPGVPIFKDPGRGMRAVTNPAPGSIPTE